MENSPPLKIITIGNSGVGKTSIIMRAVNDKFSESMSSTIGAAFETKEVTQNDQKYTLQFWDTAGQEKYQSLLPLYLRNSLVVLLVVDLSSRDALADVENYFEYARAAITPEAKVILVGNKYDLNPDFNTELLLEWSYMHDTNYFLTSAKTGFGINQLLDSVVKESIEVQEFLSSVPKEPSKKNEEPSSCC